MMNIHGNLRLSVATGRGNQGDRETGKGESERGHRGKRQKKIIVILAKVVS